MTVWLTNPAKRRKARKSSSKRATTKRRSTKKRKPPKGFSSWSAYMASIRPGGRRKKSTTRRKTVAKRKTARRRRSSARKSPATRRRRRAYRRNPPIVKTITTGIKNGVGVVLGKAAARGIPAQVGLDVSGAVGMATQAAIGLAIGMFGQKFLPRGMGEFVVAGAFASAIETAVAEADIPLLAPALAAYPGQLRAYPAASLPGGRDLSGYAVTRDASGMGFYADQEY